MSNKLTITISGMTRTADKKAIYVLFEEGSRSAEIAIPDNKIVSNKGFSDEEIAQFMEYLDAERETIYETAKTINPLRAMMK